MFAISCDRVQTERVSSGSSIMMRRWRCQKIHLFPMAISICFEEGMQTAMLNMLYNMHEIHPSRHTQDSLDVVPFSIVIFPLFSLPLIQFQFNANLETYLGFLL
mmetsp:Transcript_595/g.1166  ORF Transcript_595/g.1166 Transcript_595/m.1166 type:complete len:104 (-) Transcript_595:110-421(-)